MDAFVHAAVEFLVESLVVPIKEEAGYIISSTTYVEDMRMEFDNLEMLYFRVKDMLSLYGNNKLVVPPEVETWLRKVENIIAEVAGSDIEAGSFFNFKNRRAVGSKACKMTMAIKELIDERMTLTWFDDPIRLGPLGIVNPTEASTSAPPCAPPCPPPCPQPCPPPCLPPCGDHNEYLSKMGTFTSAVGSKADKMTVPIKELIDKSKTFTWSNDPIPLGIINPTEALGPDHDSSMECKQMEEQIGKEVKLEYLIDVLKGIPEITFQKKENEEVRLQKKCAMRKLQRVKRELAKVWNELRILRQVDKRWSIQEEVANLFDVSLRLSYPEFYPEFKNGKSTIFSCIEKFGDYQCENVLSIWHKLRKEGTMHVGPRRVGWKIKRTLEVMRPKMIGREPWVLDIGFVSIKLSGKWMAKGIHKMLRDGIDTWAPKLLMKSVLVNFPSCDPACLTQLDLLRRELIKTTLIRMLQYCKIPVEFSKPCEMDLPKEELDKFRIEKRDDGDVLIHSAGGEREPLIHAKRDEWFGNPEKDLADLWYGLQKKNARWIVCVTPVHQQEYIKMCIKAAQHATWLPLHWYDSPRASYTGYQTLNTKSHLGELAWLLDDHVITCREAAEKLGYDGEQVSHCAIKYTILKYNRLDNCTFNYGEFTKYNTFAFLLNTRFQIRSFTEKYREDIDKLKQASKLQLGKGEIWNKDAERELVLHLLKFTQVITDSCLPVLPHILCEYLYNLSKNFNLVCEVGFVFKITKLLLYEATGVVMEKCFQLLGITPDLSGQEFFDADLLHAPLLDLKYIYSEVERFNFVTNPPKTTNARFELLSVYPHITRDPSFRKGNMFGRITICDTYNILSDGWGLTNAPDHGFVSLFDCDWYNSVDITNHWPVYLGDPSSHRLVPFSPFMEIRVELYASTEESDAFFELYNSYFETDLEEFWKDEEVDTRCDVFTRHGKDGHIGLYYILLKNAIDYAIKVTYVPKKDCDGEVFAEIFAYPSSDFFDKQDPFAKNYYAARLFQSSFDPNPKIPEIPLERSMLAIPAKGSVVIEACLWDADSGVKILDGCLKFQAGSGSKQQIDAPCGSSLYVSVDWSLD